MVFREVSEDQVLKLQVAPDKDAQLSVLQSIFPNETSVVYDFHLLNFQFSLDHCFSAQQVSAWLEMMSTVFHESLSGRLKASEAFARFRFHMLLHSVQRPPFSIAVFTLENVKAASDFVLKTLCRHLSMYQHVFTPHIEITLNQEQLFKTTFPPVLPLGEGKLNDPLTVPFIEEYVDRPIPPEDRSGFYEQPDTFEPVLDPAKQLLKDELEKLRQEMEEALRLQDEAFAAKLATMKK